ncbi:MAG: leucyl aminopeptidase family protein [Mycoplasma sp.]|nr:leucyl aminopeptidase family protein [Mycoplasma sp.]
MIKTSKTKSNLTDLKGVFQDSQIPKSVNKKEMEYTYFPSDEIGYIYLGKRSEFTLKKLKKAIMVIIQNNKKGMNLEIKDFSNEEMTEEEIIKLFVETYEFETAVLWNKKTGDKKPKEPKDIIITDINSELSKKAFTESLILSESQTFARNLQTMAPNECNSETLAKMIESEFSEVQNISTKVLKLEEIKKMNMGLLLAVNSASNYEPRVVVLEYKGDPSSKEKTVMVGKGITFDAGGMNIKTGRHMLGMKYDMSGAAIVTAAMKAIASISPKANISIVAPLTDNVISNTAGLPDSVWTSMNGKTVEINNTDAEGRLVMADAITYGIRNLGATKIIDISTLTGAVLVALGQTFTGVWTTKDSDWELINKTAKIQNELVWRMPFHEDFGKYINKSLVADLKNTDLTGLGGSSSAAMFLKEFTENVDYIHLDIAGTAADNNGKCFGPMVKTLAKLF